MVGVTKAVSERFGKGGIADRMIWFNGFPFLDNKEDHTFGVPVSHVMNSDLTTLTVSGLEVQEIEKVLVESKVQGFPIVENAVSMILVGHIGRTELRYAIDRAKREQMVSPHAKCYFNSDPDRDPVQTPSASGPAVNFDNIAETSTLMSVDLSKFVDMTPISVHPRLPLETIMELFKKLGPRVILVEYRGRLTGLVTVKDCLKYQFNVEAHENPKDDSAQRESQDRLWHIFERVGSWVNSRAGRLGYNGVRLSGNMERSPSRIPTPMNASPVRGLSSTRLGDGLELEDRWETGSARHSHSGHDD